MRQEKLSELLDISIGRTPSRSQPSYWGKGHHWVSIRDLSSKIITETKEQITDIAVKDARCKIVKKGTLLFSFKLTIGKMAFAGCDLFTNEAIAAFAIKDKKKLSPDFLYYVLQSVTYGGSNQAVMGKTLNLKSLAEIEIPLPSLDDQIRIAHLLEKVEGMIAQRKQDLQQFDNLLNSVFLEMFGDPVRNEKGWDTQMLPQFVHSGKNSLKRGPFGGALKKEIFVENGYLVYEQNHALNNDYSFARYFVTEEKYQELIDFKVEPGDVLISCSGVYLGKLSIVPLGARPGIINQALLKVSLDPEKMKHRFFIHVFGSPQFKQKYFPSNRGGAVSNLPPMAVMKEIPFIYPPLNLQQEFTNIYEKVEVIKCQYKQSLKDLEALYGTLSQQAFKGELDLSRIPLSKPPTQCITSASIGDHAIMPKIDVQASPTIHLPVTDHLPAALENDDARKALIEEWLQSYNRQRHGLLFSIQDFMTAVETRLGEIYPDHDFELGLKDYEHIKAWVFEMLNDGRLQQDRNITGYDENGERILGNVIELRVVQA